MGVGCFVLLLETTLQARCGWTPRSPFEQGVQGSSTQLNWGPKATQTVGGTRWALLELRLVCLSSLHFLPAPEGIYILKGRRSCEP